jgi:hypothetical protein
MEMIMELVFDLIPGVTVEIDGQPMIDGTSISIVGVENVLPSIIDQLCEDYRDSVLVDGVRGLALDITARAFAADGIYKVDASVMTSDMAMIAADMLRESGAGDWDFETLTALKMIRASNADIEEMCTPKPAAAAAE